VVLSTHTPPTFAGRYPRSRDRRDHQAQLAEGLITPKTRFLVNPTGVFVIAAARRLRPHGAQDYCRHLRRRVPAWRRRVFGQRSFQGRSLGGLPARYVARMWWRPAWRANARCRSATPRRAEPINITVYTEGTGIIPDEQIARLVRETFDLRPKALQYAGSAAPITARRGLRALWPFGARVQLEATDKTRHCARRPDRLNAGDRLRRPPRATPGALAARLPLHSLRQGGAMRLV